VDSQRLGTRSATGARGEAFVAEHLEGLGYTIVARNARVGRLEIDLIARRDDLIVFCEVRTRTNDRMMDPIASLDRAKAQRIRKAAAAWLREHPSRAAQLRFDAASVLLGEGPPKITYYEHAF